MVLKYNSFTNEKVIYPLQQRLSNYIKNFKKLGYPNPFDLDELIIDDKVGVKLKIKGDKIQITSIRSFEKDKEPATEALNQLVDLSSAHDVVLGLSPVPYGDSGLSIEQLVMWYSKHGFVKVEGEYIKSPMRG